MRSARPKVLHALAGRPLLAHVLDAVRGAGVQRTVVVVGPPGGPVEAWLRETQVAALAEGTLVLAHQPEPRGTGHAVQCALSALQGANDPTVVILNGDVPMVRSRSLKDLAERTAGLGFATFRPEDPTGYGRVIRDRKGRVEGIREHRNCTERELQIAECNVGLYCVRLRVLLEEVPKIEPQPPADEVYLTDLVHRATVRGEVATWEVDPVEAAGVNTAEQLRQLEHHLESQTS